ncbi:MAG TPA: enoyl-CoA hydratase-related protein, partial [Acidimicrobiia bacterium]
DLRSRASELAAALLDGAPTAQMFAKQMINASFESSLVDALAGEGQAQSILLGTEDAAEGIISFLEKRNPEWKGR